MSDAIESIEIDEDVMMQDESGLQLQKYREQGLNESYFSMKNPKQIKEFETVLGELRYFRERFHVVIIGETNFLFMSGEAADLIGVPTRSVDTGTVEA